VHQGVDPARRRRVLLIDDNLAFAEAMTGYGQEQDKRNAKAAGIDHHLTKPVDEEVLASLIESAGAE